MRIHKSPKIITEEYFILATGHYPVQDDLQRCNCDRNGERGHTMCGWNKYVNLPNFQSSQKVFEKRPEDLTRVDTCLEVNQL